MVRHTIIGISYSPLYIHHFQFVQPSLLIRSEKLCKKYSDPSQINGTSEKLRWHRYRKGLRQSDVADYLGVDISTYNHLESYSCETYSPEYMKKLSALFETEPEELFDSYNSLEEMKIINQISAVYDNNNQQQIAIDIYYQLMKYIRKKLVVNADNITTVILIAYNYSLTLCREKRYNEAINIANWGRQKSIEWGRASSLGGLFYILGESFYHTGNIQKSKDQFMQAYYAFLIMDNRENSNLMKEYLLDYFDVQV